MAALEQNPADELVDYEEEEQQNDAKVRKNIGGLGPCSSAAAVQPPPG